MSLAQYIIRTSIVVIPFTALIGLFVNLYNDIDGTRFWMNIVFTTLFGFLVGVLSSILNHTRFIKPIGKINEFLEKLAGGHMLDRLDGEKLGELKSVARSINHTVDSWGNVLANVQKASNEITHYSAQLTQGADQTTKATEHISNTIEDVAQGADTQVHGVSQTSHLIHQMSAGLSQVASSAATVTESVNESLAKADSGSESIRMAGEQMESIHSNVNELSRVVKGLGDRSNEIGNIVDVITGIAAQTNLLALNAAIEAARAGEQGKGFAVVANEVRKLAEQSGNATQQISEIITQIQKETQQVVETMGTVKHEVSEGIEVMGTAGSSFTQIQLSVNSVSDQIEQVTAAIQEMNAGTTLAVSTMENISNVAAESAAATQSVLAATEQQVASMQEFSAFSNSLTKLAREMESLVNTFKI
ncbi:methyl-accepting chemotaxis protein [Peribacillus glennii]|uniref:Methyl-accepting chemotaxis protein n=1 Tax=Peribacillus glennii TaxID=2303991 RepID=A0A372LEK1_9BACI|nr:methyl-accepting chemotaxis protein [Peribacillus glennii]RFU63730.1 methyl-accepting chemotaxis protein [Peribacillus glennii]